MSRPRKKDKHLPPCVHEKHNAFYYVKGNKWTPIGSTLTEALDKYAELFQQPEGTIGREIEIAFEAIKKSKPGWSPATVEVYTKATKKLKVILKQFRVEQVKPKHVAQLRRAYASKGATFNHILSFGRQLFDYFLEEQMIESNPFATVKRHKQNRRTRLPTIEELTKIRAVAPLRLQLVIDGLRLTDQRINDVLNLDESDEWSEGLYFKQDKHNKELLIRWNGELRAWWMACKAQHRAKVVRVAFGDPERPRPIFRSRHGTRPAYRTVKDQWDRACELAGVEDCHMHDIRAYTATEAHREAGGGEAGEIAAQRLLGHSDRRTTRIYLRGREIDIVDAPTAKTA